MNNAILKHPKILLLKPPASNLPSCIRFLNTYHPFRIAVLKSIKNSEQNPLGHCSEDLGSAGAKFKVRKVQVIKDQFSVE